jgi:carboxylesterase type B
MHPPVLAFSVLLAISLAYGKDLSTLRLTKSGLVRGYLDTNITGSPLLKWLGVPYAADTSGKNRWRPPQRLPFKADVFDGTNYGPACLQGRYDIYRFEFLPIH